MATTLHVIVTCTKRKTRQIARECMLRDLGHGTIEDRFGEWIKRLSKQTGDRVRAADLYAGDHWSVVQSYKEIAARNGYDANLWVCSAGYGFLSLETMVSPYSATFSPSHPDSVCKGLHGVSVREAPRFWWDALAGWPGPEPGHPRSIAALTSEHPRSAIWVIASSVYLRGIASDLVAARDSMMNPDRLVIFSAGTSELTGLTDHLVPCDARLQGLVGGVRRSLNVRIARKALGELRKTGAKMSDLRDRFARLLARQPDLPVYDRVRMSDEGVCTFIRTHLARDMSIGCSPLLRIFRDSGHACEQRRFTALFGSVRGEFNEG